MVSSRIGGDLRWWRLPAVRRRLRCAPTTAAAARIPNLPRPDPSARETNPPRSARRASTCVCRRMLDQRAEPVRMTWQHQLLLQAASRAGSVSCAPARSRAAPLPRCCRGRDSGRSDADRPTGRRSCEIHLPAMQPFDQMTAVALDDAERNAGIVSTVRRASRADTRNSRRNKPQHDPARAPPEDWMSSRIWSIWRTMPRSAPAAGGRLRSASCRYRCGEQSRAIRAPAA